MEGANIEKNPVDRRTESKFTKNSRMIFGILFALGFLFLVFKMVINRFG
jgi:hypothetical protein